MTIDEFLIKVVLPLVSFAVIAYVQIGGIIKARNDDRTYRAMLELTRQATIEDLRKRLDDCESRLDDSWQNRPRRKSKDGD